MRPFLQLTVCIALLALLLWLGGLLWFVGQIPRETPQALEPTDAIVVLTGGAHRVEVGFELLGKGLAQKLFISGAGKGVNVREMFNVVQRELKTPLCCTDDAVVILGFDATDTVGNAWETAQWMEREDYRSLRLVTANYHLPRAMREFSRAMPEVMIVPYPVFPESVPIDRWWRSPGTLRLVISEYTKFLISAGWHGVMP